VDKRKMKLTQGFLTLFCVAIVAIVVIYTVKSVSKPAEQKETHDGETTEVYIGTNDSSSPYGGDITVAVTVDQDGKILAVTVEENNATEGIGTKAIEALPEQIVAAQGTDVDVVATATITSEALLAAVNDALAQAGIQ
jgi:uncharacterized protein with FMN-binding domain